MGRSSSELGDTPPVGPKLAERTWFSGDVVEHLHGLAIRGRESPWTPWSMPREDFQTCRDEPLTFAWLRACLGILVAAVKIVSRLVVDGLTRLGRVSSRAGWEELRLMDISSIPTKIYPLATPDTEYAALRLAANTTCKKHRTVLWWYMTDLGPPPPSTESQDVGCLSRTDSSHLDRWKRAI